MLISTLAPSVKKGGKNDEIIGVDTYCFVSQFKKVQKFAISIKDLEFKAEKKDQPETKPKILILENYHNFSNMFSKKDLNTFFFHS